MKERVVNYQLIHFLVYSQKKYLGTYQLPNIVQGSRDNDSK